MKKIIFKIRIKKNEKGAVLITSLLVILLLTVIGLTAIDTSIFEVMISGNYRTHNAAFYASDSGINITPHIIEETVDQTLTPVADFPAFTLFGIAAAIDDGTGDNDFYREIFGFVPNDASIDMSFNFNNNPNIIITVDIINQGAIPIVGGGVEFSAGAEGVGSGSTGGMAIIYDLDSFGNITSNNSQSNLGARYRLVTGVAGLL